MRPRIDFGALIIVGVMVVILAGVWGILAQQTSSSTQSGGQAPLAAGYPGPALGGATTLLPLPTSTMLGGIPRPAAFATASPGEKVEVVAVNEISAAAAVQPTPTYSFRGEYPTVEASKPRITTLYVTNPKTGETLRLGDDTGSAIMGVMTDEFAVWYGSGKSLKKGLYLHWFATNQDTWITEKAYFTTGSLEIGGRWVLYREPTDPPRAYVSALYAYNVDTDQTVLVAKDALFIMAGADSYAAINEGMVAWVGDGPTSADLTLNAYDLLQGKKWEIPTKLTNPYPRLSVSHAALVWKDWYWKGYDFAENAIFTIPVLPPGQDKSAVKGVSPVTVHGNTLQWVLEIDGTERYFTASIAAPETNKQQEMTPTPLTMDTPVPVAMPTSYP